MNFESITTLISDHQLPAFHFKTLIRGLKNGIQSYQDLTSWPASLRQSAAAIPFHSYQSVKLVEGAHHGAKAILTFSDHASIETVLIQTKPDHYSVCVSCQSGCAMGCRFCATGTLGLLRSLTPEEITDQFLYWKEQRPTLPIKSIVFMGMGEPFANQTAVFKAIDWLHTYYQLGLRHLTVSTCGLPAGIISLAQTYPQVNLAISLHAANQSLRETLMPIARTINLNELGQAVSEYLNQTNRQVTFEYLLIKDINDTKQNLDELITWLNQFPSELTHVNLIGYNITDHKFTRPSQNRIHFALDYLQAHHVSATIRKSVGEDILGACGQLALKEH